MAPIESILFWLTLTAYALAAGGFVHAVVFARPSLILKVTLVVVAGFLLHGGAIAARYHATGHLPWAGDYENGLLGGWFIIASFLWVCWRRPALQIIGIGVVPLALLLMGWGVMRNPVLSPLDASLKSWWLYIHVFFAWLAFGAFGLAMATGLVYLLKKRNAARAEPKAIYARFPSLERLDELMFRYVVFGFVNHTVTIAAGSIWAQDLWGSYWSWDPVETWSLITWLIYGLAIHLRLTRKWRGERMAWLVIFAIVGMIITFFGVTFVVETSNHVFNVQTSAAPVPAALHAC